MLSILIGKAADEEFQVATTFQSRGQEAVDALGRPAAPSQGQCLHVGFLSSGLIDGAACDHCAVRTQGVEEIGRTKAGVGT